MLYAIVQLKVLDFIRRIRRGRRGDGETVIPVPVSAAPPWGGQSTDKLVDDHLILHHSSPEVSHARITAIWIASNTFFTGSRFLDDYVGQLISFNEVMFSGQDAWRKHHLITGCARNPLPGLGTALVIFAGYCVAEAGYTYVTGMPILLFKFDMIFEDFSISDTTLDVHFLISS